jgi:hypothetical protein
VETPLPKKQTSSCSSNFPNIGVRLEYTALPSILPDQLAGWPVPEATESGTLPGMLHLHWNQLLLSIIKCIQNGLGWHPVSFLEPKVPGY